MGWRGSFLAKLDTRYAPMFIAESIRIQNGPSGIYQVASHPGLGMAVGLTGPITIDGADLDTVNCQATAGGFSFRLLEPIENALNTWVPGSIILLRMGFPGLQPDEFEVIAIGQLVSLTGPGPAWKVTCWDFFSALSSRLLLPAAGSLGTVSTLPFFYLTDASTTLGAGYTPADGTVTVVSTTGFQRETGGSYCFKITPSSGDPFYLTATGTSATTFTTVSAAGVLDTTAVAAQLGDTVTEVAYLTGHPADIIRRILASTGTGGNGTWDDYPADWAWGIADWLIDDLDIARWKTVLAGYTALELAEEAPIDDPIGWLSGWLSSIGCWLAVRQGQITMRAIQDTTGAVYWGREAYGDGDIIEVLEHQAWDDQREKEYRALAVTYLKDGSNNSATEAVGGLPAGDRFDVDMISTHAATADAVHVRDRRKLWILRRPEMMLLNIAGLKPMQHAVGDPVEISITRSVGRRRDQGAYLNRRALVTQVSPRPLENRVELRIEVLPEWSGEFGP